VTPDGRAVDAGDDGALENVRLPAQAAEDVGGFFAG
jgi:hypothetical protein